MSSIQDVANRANVSIGSVSNYLNGSTTLKNSTRKKIEEAIAYLDYTPNRYARILKTKKTNSVGILIDSIASGFGSRFVSIVVDLLEAQGISTIIASFRNDSNKIKERLDFLLYHNVDGLLFVNVEEKYIKNKLLQLYQQKQPIISVMTPFTSIEVPTILVDNYSASKKMLTHYLALGHRKIGIIYPKDLDYVSRKRVAGVEAAFAEANIELVDVCRFKGDFSRYSGSCGVDKLLEVPDITGIFVTNKNMALGALERIYERGLVLGQDISFVSYEYNEIPTIFTPKLTMIKQNVGDVAECAATMILQQLAGKPVNKLVSLEHELIFGETIQRLNH